MSLVGTAEDTRYQPGSGGYTWAVVAPLCIPHGSVSSSVIATAVSVMLVMFWPVPPCPSITSGGFSSRVTALVTSLRSSGTSTGSGPFSPQVRGFGMTGYGGIGIPHHPRPR